MARQERKKEDLFIKEKRRSKNFFVTSSAKMDGDKDRTSTTISSSVFTKMKDDFDSGDFLLDEHLISQNGSIIYMMQEMQQDLEDVYNEVSASSFQASFFPFATIDSGSFGIISSSLVPDKDSKYDLGSSGKEWNNLYVDGTAYVDSLDLNGTNINTTLNTKALKTEISGAFTSLSASIATDINNAGGSTDFTSVDSTLAPDADNTRDLGYANKEWRNLYHFVKGGNDSLSKTRRESMFIQILEGLHPEEAAILCLIKDKALERRFKITRDVVESAYPDIQWGGRS